MLGEVSGCNVECREASDNILVPKIRKTNAFFLRGMWMPHTRYAGRAMMAKSVRISMLPVVFQNGTRSKISFTTTQDL